MDRGQRRVLLHSMNAEIRRIERQIETLERRKRNCLEIIREIERRTE